MVAYGRAAVRDSRWAGYMARLLEGLMAGAARPLHAPVWWMTPVESWVGADDRPSWWRRSDAVEAARVAAPNRAEYMARTLDDLAAKWAANAPAPARVVVIEDAAQEVAR